MSKGSRTRVSDKRRYDENYEKIYGERKMTAYRTDKEFYICKSCKKQDERSANRKIKKVICMDCRANKKL